MAGRPPGRWHAAVDEPTALFLADAGSTDPGRRSLAVSAAAPLLGAVADDLAAAATQPQPTSSEVQIRGHAIRYGSMGADPTSVTAAKAATLGALTPPDPRTAQIGWALIAAAALVVVLGFVVGLAGLGLALGIVAGFAGGWLLDDTRRALDHAQEEERRRRDQWSRTEQQIGEVEAAVAELRTQAQRAAREAPATKARLDLQLVATTTKITTTTATTAVTATTATHDRRPASHA
jgi:hypothetical protein